MSDYLESEGLPGDGIGKVVDNLIQLSREKYIKENLANRDEDEKEIIEESTVFFDYVYDHEKYPR